MVGASAATCASAAEMDNGNNAALNTRPRTGRCIRTPSQKDTEWIPRRSKGFKAFHRPARVTSGIGRKSWSGSVRARRVLLHVREPLLAALLHLVGRHVLGVRAQHPLVAERIDD